MEQTYLSLNSVHGFYVIEFQIHVCIFLSESCLCLCGFYVNEFHMCVRVLYRQARITKVE